MLSYNTDIVKFKESALEALARQYEQLGFDLDYGVFFYDLLGHDLTLADVFACRLFIHNPVKIGRSPARNLIR